MTSQKMLLFFRTMVLIVLTLAWGCSRSPQKDAKMTGKDAPVGSHSHHVSAGECGQCHPGILDEWKASMHANSTALKDPLHGAVYRQVMGDPRRSGLTKNGKSPVCLKCHVPFAAMDGETDTTSLAVYNEGVSCTVCHSVVDSRGKRTEAGKVQYGVDSFVYRKKDAVSPREGLARLHPSMDLEKNRLIRKSNDLCLGCHDLRKNANGTPVCNTGEEYRSAGGKPDCVQCHMPVVDGHANHKMLAGHDFSGKTQSRGVRLNLSGNRENSFYRVRVILENRLPHKFPTAAPFRNLVLRVTGLDSRGKAIWSNYETNPEKEDPGSYFRITFRGEDGKAVPPPQATGVLGDSRLEPYERRAIEFVVPAKGVTSIRAELFYHLLLPAQVRNEKMGLPEEWKKPVLVGVADWSP